MDLSGLRETISMREKILPERSRMVGSVNGKSIIVPRIGPLGQDANRANRITNPARRGKGAAAQFQFQRRLISERMQQTAEATVSRLSSAGIPDRRTKIA